MRNSRKFSDAKIPQYTVVHEDTQRGMWRIGIVETLVSKDKEIRAVVRVEAGKGASSFLRHPIQPLYPLEVQHVSPLQETVDSSTGVTEQSNHRRKVLQRREVTQTRRMYLLLILQRIPSMKTPLIYPRVHCLLSLKSLRLTLTHQRHPFPYVLTVMQQQRHGIGSLLDCWTYKPWYEIVNVISVC